MDSAETLLRDFMAPRGMTHGGELYLPPDAARELVTRARELSLCVLGIEGFDAIGETVRPRLDLVADWSEIEGATWQDRVRKAHEESLAFFDAVRQPKVVFSISLLSERESLAI